MGFMIVHDYDGARVSAGFDLLTDWVSGLDSSPLLTSSTRFFGTVLAFRVWEEASTLCCNEVFCLPSEGNPEFKLFQHL